MIIKEKELFNIVGGINITGAFLTSLYKAANTIMDIGRALGTAIRRSVTGSVCPL